MAMLAATCNTVEKIKMRWRPKDSVSVVKNPPLNFHFLHSEAPSQYEIPSKTIPLTRRRRPPKRPQHKPHQKQTQPQHNPLTTDSKLGPHFPQATHIRARDKGDGEGHIAGREAQGPSSPFGELHGITGVIVAEEGDEMG